MEYHRPGMPQLLLKNLLPLSYTPPMREKPKASPEALRDERAKWNQETDLGLRHRLQSALPDFHEACDNIAALAFRMRNKGILPNEDYHRLLHLIELLRRVAIEIAVWS